MDVADALSVAQAILFSCIVVAIVLGFGISFGYWLISRAMAKKENVDNTGRILRILERQGETLAELVECVRRLEGISVALAAYLSRRNGEDLSRLQVMLRDMERDPRIRIQMGHQAGGVRTRDLAMESDRDSVVAAGNIDREE